MQTKYPRYIIFKSNDIATLAQDAPMAYIVSKLVNYVVKYQVKFNTKAMKELLDVRGQKTNSLILVQDESTFTINTILLNSSSIFCLAKLE